jgi:SAM-dependent methyltransferase
MTSPQIGTPDPVRDQFGAVAAAYATSSYHSSGPDLAALVAAARLTGHEQVLDLGCGAGHTALAVAPHAAAVTAVDVTPEMLAVATDLARQRGVANVTFRSADVAALPFAAASFDLVTSRVSAHHYADPAAALREAARVLRPGGSLLLIDTVAPEDPALDTFYNAVELLRDRSHVRNWRISEWRAMFAAAGFVPETLSEFTIELDGGSWVQRSQTPPEMVAAIRALFRAATPAATAAFALRDGDAWGWTIPAALLRGSLPRT